MYLITKEDFKTHLYPEVQDEITREDETISKEAIEAAIDEAKSYLSRFNLLKLFGSPEVDPEITDANLKRKVKDIAAWYLVQLANPNINLTLFRTNYEDAIKWFEKIQAGKADPDGWPYKETDPETGVDESAAVSYSSNKKRTQHF